MARPILKMLECKSKVHSTRSRMLPLAKRDLTSIGPLDVTGGRHPPLAGCMLLCGTCDALN